MAMKRLAAAQVQHNFDPGKVLYLRGDVNYCHVHLQSGHRILTSRTLKWYNDRWPHFIRIHKASLINPVHVRQVVQISPIVAHLVMCDGSLLSISRRRIAAVCNQLNQYTDFIN